MKKILVIAAVLLSGLTAYGQKQAGSIMIGGQFSLSTYKQKDKVGGIESTNAKTLDFSIRPSVHYFLTDEFAIGGSIGYSYSKELTDRADDLYDRTGIFSVRPSLIYNMEISDKFSYMPEFFIDLGSVSYKRELNENTTQKYSGFAYSVGIELLKFEFTPAPRFGLMFSCGELSYSGTSMDLSNDATSKSSSFQLGFNLAPTLGFRYYL